ncbi:unnamed protein product [Caretta caretta]
MVSIRRWLRHEIIIGALLGVCLTQALADDLVNENNEGNNGGNSHQNVNVSNQDHTADINSYNGWKVWDAVWDYSKELFATRLFNKRAYIVAKMNKDAFPSLEKLSKFKDQKLPVAIAEYHPQDWHLGAGFLVSGVSATPVAQVSSYNPA